MIRDEDKMVNEKKTLYIETTIPSYATSRESSNLVIAARQFLTKRFWEEEYDNYQLYTSQYVIDECKLGDPEAARRRLNFLLGIAVLPRTKTITELAAAYFNLLKIPGRAKSDCFHLATCVIVKIDYLLSWNCTHLGFASYVKAVEYNNKRGLWTPLLVTPDYLLNLADHEEETT
ncbi:MAG: type II toxin-antitoxin system VapC family toxin [Spirochaetaceae bacterium]|jgi:predicted nucleic acid-binding protein|nr:type II toxin-antitoxin system VapC family toxin [Spirochaetaceae bacterium]